MKRSANEMSGFNPMMMNMMQAMGGGGKRPRQTPGNSFTCSVHGKNRSQGSLTEDGAGGYCCTPESECQMGSGGGGMNMMQQRGKKGPQTPGNSFMCSVHGKNRSQGSLTEDGAGGFRCTPESECQMGVDGGASYQCSAHGRARSEMSLTDDGRGGYKCKPGMTCQIGKTEAGAGETEQVQCSVHQKPRSVQSCVKDGRGGFKCAPGAACQIAKAARGGGGNQGAPMAAMMQQMPMMQMMQTMQTMQKQMNMMQMGGGKGGGKAAFKW